jgi:hypothetical protein
LRFDHKPAVFFSTSPAMWKLSWALPGPHVLPGPSALFVPPFGVIGWRIFIKKAARITRAVLVRSSNQLPFEVTATSSGSETDSNYLTRLKAVSHRSWPQVSLFRVSGSARPPPEEPVNPALLSRAFALNFKGSSQPAWLNLSPVTWDHPVNFGLIVRHCHLETFVRNSVEAWENHSEITFCFFAPLSRLSKHSALFVVSSFGFSSINLRLS